MRGDLEQARARYEQIEESFQDLGQRSTLMIVRSEFSHVLRRMGLYDEALEKYAVTIRYFQEVQHEAAIAHSLECFAYLAVAAEEPERAAALLGAAAALRERSEKPITIHWEQEDFDRAVAQLKDMLGETEFARSFEEGAGWSTDAAVDYALRLNSSGAQSHPMSF
jgi:tetratricopeptide (TPR) repeat protein